MKFHCQQATVFAPGGGELQQALAATTHLGVGAHPDDLEFMAWHPILACLGHRGFRFSGVIASDGRASPRAGLYADLSDDEMVEVRLKEQHHAATTGEYAVIVNLMHREDSDELKTASEALVQDFKTVLLATRPQHVFTHNLADSHPHHTAVALALVKALRELEFMPETFYGGEVWRGLDWLSVADKVTFDVSAHQNLTNALMGVYDSQITGGKRYDLATAGRKRSNATYHNPLATDRSTHLEYAMDLLPLLREPELDPVQYVGALIEGFRDEVQQRLRRQG